MLGIKLLILLADCALDGPVVNEPWNVPLCKFNQTELKQETSIS
jgi:hypothetical protein